MCAFSLLLKNKQYSLASIDELIKFNLSHVTNVIAYPFLSPYCLRSHGFPRVSRAFSQEFTSRLGKARKHHLQTRPIHHKAFPQHARGHIMMLSPSPTPIRPALHT